MDHKKVTRCEGTCKKHNLPCVVALCDWKEKSALHIVDCRDLHSHFCAECVREQMKKNEGA